MLCIRNGYLKVVPKYGTLGCGKKIPIVFGVSELGVGPMVCGKKILPRFCGVLRCWGLGGWGNAVGGRGVGVV